MNWERSIGALMLACSCSEQRPPAAETAVLTKQVVVGEAAAFDSQDLHRGWLGVANELSTISCEYDVEIRWVNALAPHGDSSVSSAALELREILEGEGDTEPVFDSLATAFIDLWKVQPQGLNRSKVARFRITRGHGKVLQLCLTLPSLHQLRTDVMAVTYSDPPGQLVIGHPSRDTTLYEPQELLYPLPWGSQLGAWGSRNWVPLEPLRIRAESEESGTRSTVLLDDRQRPVAYWDRQGPNSDTILSGYYEWASANGSAVTLPLRTIHIVASPGGFSAMMFVVKSIEINSIAIEPVLVIPHLSSVVDLRGAVPRTIDGGLPVMLNGLVSVYD